MNCDAIRVNGKKTALCAGCPTHMAMFRAVTIIDCETSAASPAVLADAI
jgi:hypothetical protein